jgi:uncharacterized protein
VITNEPSQQVTPLSNEEPSGFPEQAVRHDLASPPAAPQVSQPWLDVVKAFLIWMGSIGLLIFVPVIFAIPYIAYNWINNGPPTAQALATDKTLLFLSIAGILPTHLLTLLLVWLYVTGVLRGLVLLVLREISLRELREYVATAARRPFFKTLGFEWPKNLSPLLTTVLGVLLAFVLLVIGWAVTQFLGGNKTQLDLLIESSLPARFATAFVAVLTAPLIEELIYRGVVYSALERAAGVAIAVIVVSLLFAGVHVFQYSNNIGVITVITLLSFSLTLARAYSGSVLPPFIIHLVFNGIQSLVLALAPFIDKSLLEKGEQVTPTTPGLELIGHLFHYLCRMT